MFRSHWTYQRPGKTSPPPPASGHFRIHPFSNISPFNHTEEAGFTDCSATHHQRAFHLPLISLVCVLLLRCLKGESVKEWVKISAGAVRNNFTHLIPRSSLLLLLSSCLVSVASSSSSSCSLHSSAFFCFSSSSLVFCDL